MNSKYNKYNNLYKLIFFSFIIASLLSLGLFILFSKQQDISIKENRKLVTTSYLEGTSFNDGTFQKVFEDIIVDQFIFRDNIKTLKARFDLFISDFVFLDNEYLALVDMGDSVRKRIGNTNYMMYYPIVVDDLMQERFTNRLNDKNKLKQDYPDIEMFIYKPTQAHEINLFNPRYGNFEKQIEIFDNISKLPYKFLEIDSFQQYKDYYYASDHHWNHHGAYQGYLDIISMSKPEDQVLKPIDLLCNEDYQFYGTFGNFSGRVLAGDDICIYTYDYPKYDIILDEKKIQDPKDFNDLNTNLKEHEGDYYYDAAFDFNGDTIITNREDKDNLLLIGDSFLAPVVPLLANHYNHTYIIEPAKFYQVNKEYFNYDNFLSEHKIDQIIWVYTVENYHYEDIWGPIYKDFGIYRNEEE